MVHIISPGTVTDEALLDERRGALIASVYEHESHFGIAALDLGSGRYTLLEVDGAEAVAGELERLRPAELLVSENFAHPALVGVRRGERRLAPRHFDLDTATRLLCAQFGTHDLAGFGCAHAHLGIAAAGALLA